MNRDFVLSAVIVILTVYFMFSFTESLNTCSAHLLQIPRKDLEESVSYDCMHSPECMTAEFSKWLASCALATAHGRQPPDFKDR